MTSFPWVTLITVAGPLAGALGAVWIKAREDEKGEVRRAAQARQDASENRRREAYVGFVVAAETVSRSFRQLVIDTAQGSNNEEDRSRYRLHAGGLLETLTAAAAVVEIFGGEKARECADAVKDAAKELADEYRVLWGGEPGYDETTRELDGAIHAFTEAARSEAVPGP